MHSTHSIEEYLQLLCPACSSRFVICRSCYRGHRYCSQGCRDRGYEQARRLARKKYAQSLEARMDHRDRNRVYRVRRKWREHARVMDQSSKCTPISVKVTAIRLEPQAFVCVVCGRRGFFPENAAHEDQFSACPQDFGRSDPSSSR